MKGFKYSGTGNSGTFAWFMQRVSGIAIAICGLIIFYQISAEGMHGLDSWLIMPVLLFGVWHTFSGFKSIMDDYIKSIRARFILLTIYWIAGIAMLAMGMIYI